MTKDENCVVCGLAPRGEGRPNGCAGNCEVPELEVPVEEELSEEVVEDADNAEAEAIEEVPIEEEEEVILEEEEAEEEVVEEEESLDDEDLEAYFEELPVKELKKLCKEADLSTKGKKADLVARLLE